MHLNPSSITGQIVSGIFFGILWKEENKHILYYYYEIVIEIIILKLWVVIVSWIPWKSLEVPQDHPVRSPCENHWSRSVVVSVECQHSEFPQHFIYIVCVCLYRGYRVACAGVPHWKREQRKELDRCKRRIRLSYVAWRSTEFGEEAVHGFKPETNGLECGPQSQKQQTGWMRPEWWRCCCPWQLEGDLGAVSVFQWWWRCPGQRRSRRHVREDCSRGPSIQSWLWSTLHLPDLDPSCATAPALQEEACEKIWRPRGNHTVLNAAKDSDGGIGWTSEKRTEWKKWEKIFNQQYF